MALVVVLFASVAFALERVPGDPGLELAQVDLSYTQPDVGEFQRSIVVVMRTGYCTTEPPPEFDHFEVLERPKTKQRPYRSAVISAYVRFPGREAAARKPCSGLGLRIEKRVKLKRPARQLIFFDGSVEPPRKLGRAPQLDQD